MNKVFLILGASSDIGIALINKIILKEKDVIIYAHYRSNSEKLDEIEEKNNNKIVKIKADLTNLNEVDELIKKIEGDNKIPSVIVHLPASKLEYIKLKDLDWNKCVEEINIQVGSILKIIQNFLPKMIKTENQNKIVFMLSENTIKEPAKFSTKYTMAKYMLLGFMKSINQEYDKKNININALSPSMVDTKLLSNIDRRMFEMNNLVDKMLLADEVADELYKLTSSESDELYGKNIYLAGKD